MGYASNGCNYWQHTINAPRMRMLLVITRSSDIGDTSDIGELMQILWHVYLQREHH